MEFLEQQVNELTEFMKWFLIIEIAFIALLTIIRVILNVYIWCLQRKFREIDLLNREVNCKKTTTISSKNQNFTGIKSRIQNKPHDRTA